ncbi:ABC transporter substrate-binding protein [Bradyrhizobium lablabi]|uniref:ABC transporter substrate-binding protein n=1 Tax=Bradyrhizobium lablabi TaxID=722472 RepID=UPI001BABF1C6|nr:ABC transporter substrate-binding protein [Bradyrhizobium lablabi]MBR1125938.1 ABC transporter substrate-binding protein [Bradyrhizobium lablabi]
MNISRRTALLGGASLLASPMIARAQTNKVEVVGIYSLSGTFANVGDLLNKGTVMAFDHYKTAAGKQINYTLLDDQGDAGRAVRRVQEAMGQGVRHVVGCTNSAIALAVAKEVHARGGIYIHMAGADEATGSQCNKSSFRWPGASYTAIRATLEPFMQANPAAKRWYTITGQYVFGESLLTNAKAVMQEKGLTNLGNSYHALSEREYSGYITAAMATNPDVLAVLNFGNQTVDVVRQAVSFGLKRNVKIVVPWCTGLDQYQAWGSDIVEGVYFGTNYWHGVESPGNRVLSEVVRAKTNNATNYLQACGWAVAQMFVESANKAGSLDVPDLTRAMEGLTYEGPTGTETVRAADHQVIKNYYLMRGKARSAMRDADDFAEILQATKAFMSPEQAGCKMA